MKKFKKALDSLDLWPALTFNEINCHVGVLIVVKLAHSFLDLVLRVDGVVSEGCNGLGGESRFWPEEL